VATALLPVVRWLSLLLGKLVPPPFVPCLTSHTALRAWWRQLLSGACFLLLLTYIHTSSILLGIVRHLGPSRPAPLNLGDITCYRTARKAYVEAH
jgi:hypothetical protein